jgi:hypothetical protein
MGRNSLSHHPVTWTAALLLVGLCPLRADSQTITPSPYWKNQITFPDSAFSWFGVEGQEKNTTWVKFTILLEPYEPNVYFQNSRSYVFHYTFATKYLNPFMGMSLQEFNAVTLTSDHPQAVLGSIIFPPSIGSPPVPQFAEYGIQFAGQKPFTRDQIRDLFHLVVAHVAAPPEVQAYYFPTYEQQAVATANRDWLQSEGVPVGSTARWAQGNTCYSQGWALGRLKFFPGDRIADSYHNGRLEPNDVLLTDGVPAEVPFVAGIVSLAPSTPNSHVAILARAYAIPFVHLALAADAEKAQQLIGRRILFSAYEDDYGALQTRLTDVNDSLDEATAARILRMKEPAPLAVAALATCGTYGLSAEGLLPSDMRYVGGKAANFGILRTAIPDNSPKAVALTFDLWEAFLDQPLEPTVPLMLGPGEYMVFWADGDEEQGPTHTSFQLSRGGESVALFDVDGRTLLDAVAFGPQKRDVSYGRSTDGNDAWQVFATPTPGQPNAAAQGAPGSRLVINEVMADNRAVLPDPLEPDQYPDWIELYNGSGEAVVLSGMYLTDDPNEPTKWQIVPTVAAPTLRQEIAWRLSPYRSYPVRDMVGLSRDLAAVRSLFTNPHVTQFREELRAGIAAVLTDPANGLDPSATWRFRSSTNVEDSVDFIGAGLYDSFSGCLADDLDADNDGPCACDPNRRTERSAFGAIRQTLASFYNDNAFLERLRHDVNETQVGMAMIVHSSFPDEIELANGVATLERTDAGSSIVVTLVTQKGAVSVTNPADGSTPEETVVEVLPSGYIKLNAKTLSPVKRSSSLVPLGQTVMDWIDDYQALVTLLLKVSERFAEVTGKAAYILDLEYKKLAPGGRVLPEGGLVVKQVRQMPTPHGMQTPFLVNTPTEFEVYTGEFELNETADVFANHRLKSRWTLGTRSIFLDSNSLSEGLYTEVHVEYLDGVQVRTLTDDMARLPFAGHSFGGSTVVDTWQLPELDNPRTCSLRTLDIPTAVPAAQNPLLTLGDFGASPFQVSSIKCLGLDVEYERPVPSYGQQKPLPGSPPALLQTVQNRVYLWACQPARDDDIFVERSVAAGGISVRTSFYTPAPPTGFRSWVGDAMATAPLKRWEQTVIEGLTTEPIVLKGYYSQTYRPEHHNLIEHFLFEPRLEPGLPESLRSQLQARNVRFIHVIVDNDPEHGDRSLIQTYGFDE